jgi:hypothetical protein
MQSNVFDSSVMRIHICEESSYLGESAGNWLVRPKPVLGLPLPGAGLVHSPGVPGPPPPQTEQTLPPKRRGVDEGDSPVAMGGVRAALPRVVIPKELTTEGWLTKENSESDSSSSPRSSSSSRRSSSTLTPLGAGGRVTGEARPRRARAEADFGGRRGADITINAEANRGREQKFYRIVCAVAAIVCVRFHNHRLLRRSFDSAKINALNFECILVHLFDALLKFNQKFWNGTGDMSCRASWVELPPDFTLLLYQSIARHAIFTCAVRIVRI